MPLDPLQKQAPSDEKLELFCSKVGDAYRVLVRPQWLPDYLRACFDEEGEAFPIYLDLEELERYMTKREAPYVKRIATTGSVQLYAEGTSAGVLARWLSRSISSGQRV